MSNNLEIFNEHPEETLDDNCKIEFSENEKGFSSNFLIKHETLSKIRKIKLDLKKEGGVEY